MCGRKTVLVLFMWIMISGTLIAEQSQYEITHFFLISPQNIFDLPKRTGPDQPNFEYSHVAGTWRAKCGGSIVIYGLQSEFINAYVSLDSFFQLHNFSTDQPISWEALRAYVGLMFFFEFPALNNLLFPGSRIICEAGLFHQDGNVANLSGYEASFFNGGYSLFDLEYTMFNSFEYIHFRLTYMQALLDEKLVFFISGGIKKLGSVFVSEGSIRKLDLAFSVESGIAYTLTSDPDTAIWFGFYYELTTNDFVSNGIENPQFSITHNKEDYIYAGIDCGLEFENPTGFCVRPYIGYSYHHGRGVDFLKLYEGFCWGIKLII